MEVNEHGVIIDYEKEMFIAASSNNYSGSAYIGLGEHEGHWYVASNLSLASSGYGASPSISRNAYAEKRGITYRWSTRQEALDAGLVELTRRLEKEISKSYGCCAQSIKQAKELLIQIQQSKQLSLF